MQSLFTDKCALKICGITTDSDALGLVECGVEALGFNFWPQSKRYIEMEKASQIAQRVGDSILKVGVFVNAPLEHILTYLKRGVIDVAQLHGGEDVVFCRDMASTGFPFIKAIGVKNADSLGNVDDYLASAILLDAHAPDVYGGTGDTFDWNLAKQVKLDYPDIPVMLAGGITPENAAEAARAVLPSVLDVASGAELSPGVKDFKKVAAIKSALDRVRAER